MIEAGLILEGGGMKGVYTAGVLDFFLDKELEFSNCYGVSAGAGALSSYLSKQKGRAYRVMTEYLGEKRYMGLYSFFTTGDFFNAAMCYDLIPRCLDPLDYEKLCSYPGKAYAVVTNILTGRPEYHSIIGRGQEVLSVRASASLPLLSRNVLIHHIPYLDGGISDSIPIRRSIADGNRKNVVILTKDMGYVRRPTKYKALLSLRYIRYPSVAQQMKKRHIVYNDTMRYLEEQERKGEVFLIRPSEKMGISRTEMNPEKLERMYKLGYLDAEASYERMMNYLTGESYN